MIHSTVTINKITAEEGMILTNGKVYLKEVCLTKNSNASDWVEITEAEYQEILKNQEDSLGGEGK